MLKRADPTVSFFYALYPSPFGDIIRPSAALPGALTRIYKRKRPPSRLFLQ